MRDDLSGRAVDWDKMLPLRSSPCVKTVLYTIQKGTVRRWRRELYGKHGKFGGQMRTHFPGYYPPTERDMAEMWHAAVFAVDANVLLNLFRYTAPTRDRLLTILERLQDRLWLPYQAAAEFHRNRLGVIASQETAYDKLTSDINKGFDAILGLVRGVRHPVIETSRLVSIMTGARDNIGAIIADAKESHPGELTIDEVFERVTTVFDGKVGDSYKPDELTKKLVEAKKRVEQEIPPGYKDKGKEEPRRYGDVVLWFQLLDFARSNNKPLIFVTDDTKEDWWLEIRGKTIGPRPELIQEMRFDADTTFYMYQPDRFMEYAATYLNLPIQPEVIAEAKYLSDDERVRQQMQDRLREARREAAERQAAERAGRQAMDDAVLYQMDLMFQPPILTWGIGETLDLDKVIADIGQGEYPRWNVVIDTKDKRPLNESDESVEITYRSIMVSHSTGPAEVRIFALEEGPGGQSLWRRVDESAH